MRMYVIKYMCKLHLCILHGYAFSVLVSNCTVKLRFIPTARTANNNNNNNNNNSNNYDDSDDTTTTTTTTTGAAVAAAAATTTTTTTTTYDGDDADDDADDEEKPIKILNLDTQIETMNISRFTAKQQNPY